MTQEEKELLLIDLCGRLLYGVMLNIDYYDLQGDGKLKNRDVILSYGNVGYCSDNTNWVSVKPYLRPMSSMTEEEKRELLIYILGDRDCIKYFKVNDDGSIDNTDAAYQDLNNFNIHWINFDGETTTRYIDYLLKNHFDYRGLIERGLAISVTKENNPYEKEQKEK